LKSVLPAVEALVTLISRPVELVSFRPPFALSYSAVMPVLALAALMALMALAKESAEVPPPVTVKLTLMGEVLSESRFRD
jgi:hypothetical protein